MLWIPEVEPVSFSVKVSQKADSKTKEKTRRTSVRSSKKVASSQQEDVSHVATTA
jgi:hypothetical protein